MRAMIALSVALLPLAGGALAQPGGGPASTAERTVAAFAACRAITDEGRRLACYDQAAGALETAVKSGDVTIVDRQDVRRARRSLFGFALPSLGFLRGNRADAAAVEAEEAEFREINTTVKSARLASPGRFELVLDDGAVWQTTESLGVAPRPGTAVRIRQGALNGYFLRVDGRSVKAVRLR